MTKPKELHVGDRVKMVRDDFHTPWAPGELPLGKIGTVVGTNLRGEQEFLVSFEDWEVSWTKAWYCTRNELRKLPSR